MNKNTTATAADRAIRFPLLLLNVLGQQGFLLRTKENQKQHQNTVARPKQHSETHLSAAIKEESSINVRSSEFSSS
jgi:hypothetical protein